MVSGPPSLQGLLASARLSVQAQPFGRAASAQNFGERSAVNVVAQNAPRERKRSSLGLFDNRIENSARAVRLRSRFAGHALPSVPRGCATRSPRARSVAEREGFEPPIGLHLCR